VAAERQSTGIEGLDRLLGGGIPRGSRSLLIGPHGGGLTVFAMQFLWAGLEAGETVAYDVWDRPWPKLRAYFGSFGWDVAPHEESRRLIPIQSFPHFEPYPRDPRVRYFALPDFEEMKRIDLELSRAGVSRFVFGDSYEHIFHDGDEAHWHAVEQWTVHWTHHDRITNLDLVHEAAAREPQVQRLMDFTLLLADNVLRFRARELRGRWRRELRIERMEGVAHPLDWLPFEVTPRGIRLLEAGAGFRKPRV
jgi:circadian clock protein KaiC